LWFGNDTQVIEEGRHVTFLVRNQFRINGMRRHCSEAIREAMQERNFETADYQGRDGSLQTADGSREEFAAESAAVSLRTP
jgi:hypothetical protein